MQFESVLRGRDLDEAAKLTRRWYYWPRFIFANLYFFILLALTIPGFFYNLFRAEQNLEMALICFLIAAALSSYYVWLYRRNSRKRQESLDKLNPVRYSIESTGVVVTEKSGTTSTTPWSEYSSVREAPHIFLLVGAGSKKIQIIAKGELSATDVDRLRSLLGSQIA